MQPYLPIPEMIVLSELPSVPVVNVSRLPESPGIYFVLEKERVLYIGRTQSLRVRWSMHHRLEMYLSRPDITISWLVISNNALLPSVERACIEYFNPSDNGQRYEHSNSLVVIQVLKETRRKLKQLAMDKEKPMYQLLEELLDQANDDLAQGIPPSKDKDDGA